MEKYKLSESDMKQIAHFAAQRQTDIAGNTGVDSITKKYLEYFNEAISIINEYNNSKN